MPPERISLPAFAGQAVWVLFIYFKNRCPQKAVESYLPFFPLWSPRSLIFPSWKLAHLPAAVKSLQNSAFFCNHSMYV